MGLFNRKQNKQEDILTNSININTVDPSTIARPFFFNFKKGRFNYADLVLYVIFEKLFNGLKNVTWKSAKINYTAYDVTNFIENNSEILIYHYFKNGFAVIMHDKNGYLRLPQRNELKIDSNGMVINKNAIVIYSDPYILERKTHFGICLPYLNDINDNMNNSNYVGNQQGIFGILSSAGIPMSPAAKDEMNEKLKKNYGMSEDKFNFILSNNEMNWTAIDIPVDKLKFDEKTTNDFKWISNLFGINPDFFLGGSTFSNQADATKNFYRTAIVPLAEVLLRLGRAVFIAISNELEPSTIITYDLANIPEMASTLTAKCNERSVYLDYLLKLRAAGVNVDTEIRKLGTEIKTMLTDV